MTKLIRIKVLEGSRDSAQEAIYLSTRMETKGGMWWEVRGELWGIVDRGVWDEVWWKVWWALQLRK